MEKVLYIDGNITQRLASDLQFILDSKEYMQVLNITSFHLKINCLGGDLSATQTIVNLFKDSGLLVNSTILGFCQSAAPILAMAVSKIIYCYDNASIMLHNSKMYGELHGENLSQIQTSVDQGYIQEDWAIDVVAKRTYASVDSSKINYDAHRKTIVQKFFNGLDNYIKPIDAYNLGMVDQIKSSSVSGVSQMSGVQLNAQMLSSHKGLNTKKSDTIKSLSKKIKNFMQGKITPAELAVPVVAAVSQTEPVILHTEPVAQMQNPAQTQMQSATQPQTYNSTELVLQSEISKLQTQMNSFKSDAERHKNTISVKDQELTSLRSQMAQRAVEFDTQLQGIGGGAEVLKNEISKLKAENLTLQAKMQVDAQDFDMKIALTPLLDKGKFVLTNDQKSNIISTFRAQTTLKISEMSNDVEVRSLDNKVIYNGSLQDAIVKFAYENKHLENAPQGVVIGSNATMPEFQMRSAIKEHEDQIVRFGKGYGSKWDIETRMAKGLPYSEVAARSFGLIK
jgi:ATP-dependent protease ClpP protease subunit